MFTDKERELLLKAISNEQISMIVKDHTMYEDNDYKKLEELKIKIKDIPIKIEPNSNLNCLQKGTYVVCDEEENN